MRISKPGIYQAVAAADYFEDPCPEPSLTQSIAKILISQSPLHAKTAHPRLNPDFEADDATKFDLGNVAHALMLGRGKDFDILPFDDWRKKDAQQAREESHLAGRVAILAHQFDQATEMVVRAEYQLIGHEDFDAFKQDVGSSEVMIAWQEEGFWFRSLIDFAHIDFCTIDDYKTSGMSMAPHVIGIRAEAAGWHVQAAFIERGLDILDPANAGRRRFRFVAQETEKPHALTVMHMDENWMTMGRKQVETAVTIWKRCMRTDHWPSYTSRSIVPVFPSYKESKWLERELSGEFDTSLTMAG